MRKVSRAYNQLAAELGRKPSDERSSGGLAGARKRYGSYFERDSFRSVDRWGFECLRCSGHNLGWLSAEGRQRRRDYLFRRRPGKWENYRIN
jgi:hypothetical protein